MGASAKQNIFSALLVGLFLFLNPSFTFGADHKRDKIMNKAAEDMTRALDVSSSGIEKVSWDGNSFVFRLEYQPDFSGFSGSGDDGYQFLKSEFMTPLLNEFRQSEIVKLLASLNAGLKIILPLSRENPSEYFEFDFSAQEIRDFADSHYFFQR